MQVKLLQNVSIDGTVVEAGTVIDCKARGVSGESMIAYQWAVEHKPSKRDDSKPAESKPAESKPVESFESAPDSQPANEDAPVSPKPKTRRPRKS